MTAWVRVERSAAAGRDDRAVALWLLACCAMIFAMVVIGGITRLTESGLSITRWQPIAGVLPPLDEAQWQAEFDRYREIPQYSAIHASMTLGEFKRIYFWEYLHRLWGRLIGVVFAVPFLVFLIRGQLARTLAPRLAVIFVLGGLQGVLGWYMVKSGLADRIEVSQYRLAAHLLAAVLLYAAILWTALDLLRPRRGGIDRGVALATVMVLLTMLAGAFVAGLRAGYIYNTFPLMGGALVPGEYGALVPWWRNWFENATAAQFDHRLLAELTWLLVALLWLREPRPLAALFAFASLQAGLGIATLLLVVPLPVAVLHQAGALALLTAALVTLHRLGRPLRE
jgi:heme a synthase